MISHTITRGYGNGTLVGSPSLVLRMGYGAGEAVVQTYAGGVDAATRGFGLNAKARGFGLDAQDRGYGLNLGRRR